jgi:signal transduction histidine kinase
VERLENTSLVESQKMEALGRMAREVAHDFNNLLVVVMMSGDLLRRMLPPGGPELVHVEEMIRAAERGSALTRQLSTFACGCAGYVETIDVAQAFARIEGVVRDIVGPSITVRTFADSDVWRIAFDRRMLEQILVNLAANAHQAMPERGVLTLTATNTQLLPAQASARSVEPGTYVLLSVNDTGLGMPPEIVDRVFEPFFTTRPDTGGHGLGLSLVYGIVTHGGGHVEVRSVPGVGTSVDLYIPAVVDE